MPLAERVLEPFTLGSGSGRCKENSKRGPAHLSEANDSIVGVLQQLASLVRHADDIFCDISDECQKIFERTEKVSKKLIHIEENVKNLDAKKVEIPVGDLSRFSQVKDHHEAKHGFNCDIFTRETRPQCIKDQYNLSEVSPSNIIRAADIYRKDGMCGSKIFRLWPMVLKEPNIKTPDLGFTRRVGVKSFEKRYKRLKDRPKTIHITSDMFPEDRKQEEKENKDEHLSSLPPTTIPIDTSGTGFMRMQFLRESMKKIEKEDANKKKKRRRTVSGVPENIMHELEQFERKHRRNKSLTDQTKLYSYDDLDTSIGTERDETMAKYLDEIDAKMEERNEDGHYLKEPKIMKLFPCRRSKSLPRCVKLYSQKRHYSERESVVSSCGNSTVSLASMGSAQSRLSRSTKRSSIMSAKFKALVRSVSKERDKQKPRPKSLDLDAIDFEKDIQETLALTKMPSMPDAVLLNEDRQLKVGPGSYYNFESSTLPRSFPRRKETPWENIPKDWTTSVKLREITKSRSSISREDKCSSGHWSGSSSNRHSMDSDHVKSECMQNATSRCGTESTGGYGGDEASTTIGDGDSSNESKAETEAWLQSLAARAASRDEISSSSADTLNSLSQLTKKNIMALDLMMSPSGRKPLKYLDDEEESVYSLDQEGFYTSFHNDSGLRRSTDTLDAENVNNSSPIKDSHSICSVESVIHNPDLHTAGIKKASPDQQHKPIKRVGPPLPPPRTSSITGTLSSSAVEDGSEIELDNTKISSGDYSRQDSSSVSESDQESIYTRVKIKTKISSTMIPSLCPVLSDDDSLIGRRQEGDMDSLLHDEDVYLYRKDLCEVIDMNHNSEVKNETGDPSMFSISSFDGSVSDPSLSINKSEILSDQSYRLGTSDSKTLPRNLKYQNGETNDYTRSWPRTHNKAENSPTSPLSGILKNSDQTLGGPKPPKSLNFSPVINMFNPDMPQAVQVPLPSSPSSSEDGGHISKGDKLKKLSESSSYQLTVPLGKQVQEKVDSNDLPLKYQPIITVKPGNRPKSLPVSEKVTTAYVNVSEMSNNSYMPSTNTKYDYSVSQGGNVPLIKPTPQTPNCYAVSPVYKNASHVSSKTENESGPISSVDSGYMDMNGNGGRIGNHSGSLNSISSFDSFDTKDSLTYVSMTSPCSSPNLSNLDIPLITTPTGSIESLQNVTKTNGYSGDESSLGTTMETIAITTNSFNSTLSNESFSSNNSQNKSLSFRTFSGPMSPVQNPVSSSTPYTSQSKLTKKSPDNLYGQNHRQNVSKDSYSGRTSYYQDNSENQGRTSGYPQNKMVSSQSVPSSMSLYVSNKEPAKQIGRPGPVVNIQNLDQSNPTVRSGSYRVAMGNTYRNDSYRVALKESTSCPLFPQQQSKPLPSRAVVNQNNPGTPNGHMYRSERIPSVPADFSRTDSYRVAVRNTHESSVGVSDQNKNRNSSYRVAVCDNEPVFQKSPFDSVIPVIQSGRDIRRMGITDVDQLKSSNSPLDNTSSELTSNVQKRSSSRQNTKKVDVDPISVLQIRENGRSDKSKSRPTSSTYICFDPIFEVGEDMTNSMESLRAASSYGSLKMNDYGSGSSLHHEAYKPDKTRVNALNGKVGKTSSGEKTSTSSLFGSIKNTFKTKSNKQPKEIEIEDDWRFTSV
ncbi:hypothetical protein KUTeg_007755 [Tegillarca granosa]|uniref:WASP family protein member n=1 Tax=Tegillarca granosa TaxID=220873 RepID=A0ABQ9FE62_TEGGR|nr:hypothetical protein KUTeg_007755 [Tegillarca granosa]